METRICHNVKTDVLDCALNSAVDKGLVLAQTHKISEGMYMVLHYYDHLLGCKKSYGDLKMSSYEDRSP